MTRDAGTPAGSVVILLMIFAPSDLASSSAGGSQPRTCSEVYPSPCKRISRIPAGHACACAAQERSGRRIGRRWLEVEVEEGVGRRKGAVELGRVKPVAGADEELDAAGHARPGRSSGPQRSRNGGGGARCNIIDFMMTNRRQFIRQSACTAAAVAMTRVVPAETPAARSLFDGKTLAGWRAAPQAPRFPRMPANELKAAVVKWHKARPELRGLEHTGAGRSWTE